MRTQLGLAMLLAVVIIAVMVIRADPEDVLGKIQDADLGIIAMVVGLYLVNTMAKIVRWYALVSSNGHSVPFGRLALYFLIGLSLNNSTPGRIAGEPARAYLLKTGTDYPMGRGMASIFLEKTIDTIVTISLALVGILLLINVLSSTATTSLLLSVGMVALFMGGLITLVAFPQGPRRVSAWVFAKMNRRGGSERVASLEALVDGFLGNFEKGTRDIAHDRPKAMAAIGLSIVIWLNEALRLWLIFLALGFNVSAELMLVATTLSSFAALLIPLGAGNSAAIAVICGVAGIDADLATTASIVFIMTSIWISVPLGAGSMAITGIKARDVLTRSVPADLAGGRRMEPDTRPEGHPKTLDVPDQQRVPDVPDPP
jgi:uncharacterized protein (TIRG00374 family)